MPKLKDVRGQMVFASGYNNKMGFGMNLYPGGSGWNAQSKAADVRMAIENHCECDNIDKMQFLNAFYRSGTAVIEPS